VLVARCETVQEHTTILYCKEGRRHRVYVSVLYVYLSISISQRKGDVLRVEVVII
jgi:hypothetical protein